MREQMCNTREQMCNTTSKRELIGWCEVLP